VLDFAPVMALPEDAEAEVRSKRCVDEAAPPVDASARTPPTASFRAPYNPYRQFVQEPLVGIIKFATGAETVDFRPRGKRGCNVAVPSCWPALVKWSARFHRQAPGGSRGRGSVAEILRFEKGGRACLLHIRSRLVYRCRRRQPDLRCAHWLR
jgi:hypothetical protein